VGINTVNDHLWKVRCYLMKRHGVDAADRIIDPLEWYISTGRASGEFLRKFVGAKPFVIGRVLEKGGTHEEAVARVKAKLRIGGGE